MTRFFIHVEEYGSQLDMLNIEQKGRLLDALITVARDQAPDEGDMDDLTRMCFSFFRDRMFRDVELSQKRANSGRKGGEANGNKTKQNEANENNEKQGEAPKPEPEPEPITKKEKDICVSGTEKSDAEEMFRRVWMEYPNKKGLGSISITQKVKLFREVGEEQLLRALHRYLDEMNTKGSRGDFVPAWKNGGTWFKTGYVDYLDKNFSPSPPDPKQKVIRTAVKYFENQKSEAEKVEIARQLDEIMIKDMGL